MKLVTWPMAIMIIVVVVVRLCMGCSSEEELTPYSEMVKAVASENWDCDMHRDGFNDAFLGCVEKMHDNWPNQKDLPGAYSVPECKQYAYKLYCEPFDDPCKKAVERAKDEERRKWSRRIESMCAALKGTCFELNMASKYDHACDSACDFGEPVVAEIDTDTDEAEKEEQ